MKIINIILLSVLITACSNKSPNDVVAVKAGDDYYRVDASAARALEGDTDDHVMCTRRSVVGSNRKQKVCTTRSEIESNQQDARDIMEQHQSIKAKRLAASKGGG